MIGVQAASVMPHFTVELPWRCNDVFALGAEERMHSGGGGLYRERSGQCRDQCRDRGSIASYGSAVSK